MDWSECYRSDRPNWTNRSNWTNWLDWTHGASWLCYKYRRDRSYRS